MSDKLSIYSDTLIKLGQRPLATLTDLRPEQRAIDRSFDRAVKWMLESGLWKFATRTDELQTSNTATSQFGYNMVYEIPSDFVRIYRISDNNRFRPQLVDFRDRNGFFYCDNQPLFLEYISNDPSYGYNIGLWPESFVNALVDELAVRTAPYLQGAGIPKLEDLKKDAKRSLYWSKSKDAFLQPEGWLPLGRMARSRAGRSNVNNMRRTPYI